MKWIDKLLIQVVKNLRFLSSISARLVKITGKSDRVIHPKHLLPEDPWFVAYLKKTDRVLDLGCGYGHNCLKASLVAKKIIGIDKVVTDQKNGNIILKNGDLEKKLEFADGSFDVVLCLDTLEHLYNRDQLLREVRRILRSDGRLFLSLPNRQTGWKKLQRSLGINSFADPDHKKEYSLEEILKLCRQAGFRVISTAPVVLDTPLAPVIDIVGGLSISLYARLQKWKERKVIQHPEDTSGYRIICKKYD